MWLVLKLGYGRDGPVFQSRQGYFSLFFKKVPTGPGAQTASYKMGAGSLSRGSSGRGLMLTTYLHLVPRFCFPYVPSLRRQEQFYLYLYLFFVLFGDDLQLLSFTDDRLAE